MTAAYVAAKRLPALLAAAAVLAAAALFAEPAPAHAISVCVDPGHGGPYSNSNHHGLREKDVNLWIALDLREELASRGHTVAMTRVTDRAVCLTDIPTWSWSDATGRWSLAADGVTRYADGVPRDDLQARCGVANANGVDLFVSIHNNGSPSASARGYETHASAKDALALRLRQLVQEEVVRETGLNDRGVWSNDFYVVRWSNMPAILVEGAYISNPADAALLKDPRFRRRIARGIARGIERWLAEDPYREHYPRLAGADRHSTAASVSAAGWPAGAPAAIVTGGDAYAETLVSSALARKLAGPILLTRADALHPAAAEELARLRPTEVVVVGGEDTVADGVLDEIASAAGIARGAVRRIGGGDAYETAALVADEVGVRPTDTVFLASGERLADALSVSPLCAQGGSPVLLTRASDMPTVTAAWLATRAHARTYVIGGTLAVPETQTAGMPGLLRFAGPDRYGTNMAVLSAFYGRATSLRPYAASGVTLVDALTIGPKAGGERQPVLLTGGRTLAAGTRLWVTNSRPRIAEFTMCGGALAQPYLMDWILAKADAE